MRTWIGENVYRSEDAVLGYATDAMAPLVTTEARLRHADRVAQHALHSESAAELTDSLRAERDDARRSSIGDRQFVADLVMTVSAARSRFASWPIHPGLTDESRRRVPNVPPDAAG